MDVPDLGKGKVQAIPKVSLGLAGLSTFIQDPSLMISKERKWMWGIFVFVSTVKFHKSQETGLHETKNGGTTKHPLPSKICLFPMLWLMKQQYREFVSETYIINTVASFTNVPNLPGHYQYFHNLLYRNLQKVHFLNLMQYGHYQNILWNDAPDYYRI